MTSESLKLQPAAFGENSQVILETDRILLQVPAAGRGYRGAQIDDYRELPRASFPWHAPCRMTVEARVSHPNPPGTFGFGFWNDPFTLASGQGGAARRFPTLPDALWFFHGSPPNDFGFHESPEPRWRAASIRSIHIPAVLLAPAAAAGLLLSTIPGIRRPVIRAGLRLLHTAECGISTPADSWHRYELDWQQGSVRFAVDGQAVLEAAAPPAGPLGFVAWIDNQYATVSPEHGIRFGTLPLPAGQSLHLRNLVLE